MPLPKNPLLANETKTLMSLASKKKWENQEYRDHQSKIHTGKKQSPETIAKRVSKIKGKIRAKRNKCIICGKEYRPGIHGIKNPTCSMECKSEFMKTRTGSSAPNYQGGGVIVECIGCNKNFIVDNYRLKSARFCSASCKMSFLIKKGIISTSHPRYGSDHHNWKGGISFEPYCPKFTNEFKERVRAFFDYQCLNCGTPQNGYKLHVHHVNFDKETCCNESIPLFIPLCRSCHTKSNHHRESSSKYFTEIIQTYYQGKCYFSKEEMQSYNCKKI
jgi:hypothetical protein